MSDQDNFDLPVPLDDGSSQPAGWVLEEARRAAANGQVDVGAELFLLVCSTVLEAGRAPELQLLLNEFHRLFTDEPLSSTTLIQSLYLEGAMYSRLGHANQARALFEAMLSLAEESGERDSAAQAHFNLANQDFAERQLESADHRYRLAFQAWNDLGDYYGAIRALQNIANVALSNEDLERADRILDTTNELYELVRGEPYLRFTGSLLKAQLAIKRHRLVDAAVEFRHALRYARQTGDALAECVAIQNVGSVYADLGEYRRALPWLRKGIRLAEQLSAQRELGLLHRSLAITLIGMNRLREAQEAFESARSMYIQIGDDQTALTITADMGTLAVQTGDLEQGRQVLVEALESARLLDSVSDQLLALRGLLLAEVREPDPVAAVSRANELLNLLPEDAPHDRANILTMAAEAALSAIPPQFERAQTLFDQALKTFDQQSATQQSITEPNTDQAYSAAQSAAHLSQYGGYDYAVHFYDLALDIYQTADAHEMEFHVRNDRAIALTQLEKYEEARSEYLACLAQAEGLENRAMELQAIFNLGELDHRDGNLDDAIIRLDRAITLARTLGDEEMEVGAHNSLGIALLKAERFEDARVIFTTAEQMGRRLNDRLALAGAIGGLAGVAFSDGDYRRAGKLYGRAATIQIKEQDWSHAAEDLGGQLQSLAELGKQSDFERHSQVLIDLAQDHLLSPQASETFLRCALTWLQKSHLEAATNSYAVALALSLNHYGVISDDILIEKFAEIAARIAAQAFIAQESQTNDFYQQLYESMNNLHPEFGESFRPLIEKSRTLVEKHFINESESEP